MGCLEVSWTVMLLFCCKLCYTKWYSILSYFRKLDVTRYHKCSTFSKTGRAISGIGHTPFDVILLVSTWQRVVSTVRPSPFFFDTIMQMIAYLIRFWLLLSLTISCPALRLCCYSLYLSLFRGKPVSFFFWLRNAAAPWKTLGFYHVQIHHVLFTWARTFHSTPEGLGGQFVRGTQRQFLGNICSEDDYISRIFGTFVVKFLACLPLLGFWNI